MGQEGVNEKTLNVRLPEAEFAILAAYAKAAGRTKTEVIREFIRSLTVEEKRKTPKKSRKK
jgi:hypothetical protein